MRDRPVCLERRREIRDLDDFIHLTGGLTKHPRGAFRAVIQADPCAYCGVPRGGTLDHIDARAEGGANVIANLTGSCARCNAAKGTRSVLEFLAGTMRFASPPGPRPNRLVYSAFWDPDRRRVVGRRHVYGRHRLPRHRALAVVA